jgi:hypothetical protein
VGVGPGSATRRAGLTSGPLFRPRRFSRAARRPASIPAAAVPRHQLHCSRDYETAYKVGHRLKSVLVVQNRGSHLNRLLGSLLLPDVTQERISAYMVQRQFEGASNRTINLDLLVLSRAMAKPGSSFGPK